MKYLIVVLVVVVVAWLLFRGRSRGDRVAPGAAPKGLPQAMVRCEHCGVHLPRSDALLDSRGAFCTDAHRLAGPRSS